MDNLGANLWQHSLNGKTASIRAGHIQYKARCQSKHGCTQSAVIQIECRDSIGHPFWNRDFCEAHAKAGVREGRAPQNPGILAAAGKISSVNTDETNGPLPLGYGTGPL